MKIGFTQQYTDRYVTFAAEAGFDCLELLVAPGAALDANQPATLTAAAERCAALGVEITSFIVMANHLAPDLGERALNNEFMAKTMRQAAALGVRIVSTNTWGDPHLDLEGNLPAYTEVFSRYAEVAEEVDVVVAQENCPHLRRYPLEIGNIGYTPEAWEAMFAAVPSWRIGLEFDPSHLMWLGVDYVRAVFDFGERIHLVHAKDTEVLEVELGRVGIFGEGWWRYRMPGWGEINWKSFLSALYEIGYDGALIIEHEDPVFEGERYEEGLRMGLRYLRQMTP
ncbi:MAG TPA: sugar phosphate isomerase/epimerase [Armatimonadota bacterium]|jgi:sugar phosphate isomerase/epimerase